MRKTFYFSVLAVAIGVLNACTSTTNTNLNVNGTRTTSKITTNTTVMNTANNAANSMSNTVSNTAAALTTPSAEEFMKMAAEGGMAEVELGKLAASKAKNLEVKKYGQMMVGDHGKANAELKTLAAKKNVVLPTDIGSFKTTKDQLTGLSGAEFDSAYVDAMVEDHEKDVSNFQKQADGATDAEVKAFAVKTLPVLKKHLEAIKAIQTKMQ